MVLYGWSVSVMEEKIQGEYPVLLQSLYADYFSTEGVVYHPKPAIAHIEALGNICGLFLERDKSQFV